MVGMGIRCAVDDDDEEELAEGEYVVEKLINRRYSPTSCSKLEYMVRWKGYGAEEDGWEERGGRRPPARPSRCVRRLAAHLDPTSVWSGVVV